MEKMKFKTVGQFMVALEEGLLFDENGTKYVLSTNNAALGLVVEKHNEKGDCCRFATLEGANAIVLAHTFMCKPLPRDKDLVQCWDNESKTCRCIKFYDAKNDCTFFYDGPRCGEGFDNYQVIEPNSEGLYEYPFDWANEVKKELED